MSDLSLIPLQDGYESQLSQDWDGATGTVYVLATPSYTPTTTNTYIVVNPGKTNMQIAEITDYDSTAKTLTVSSISFEKGLGISSTAQSHSTGSKVIISDNYQFWEDIQTAVNSKLDDTGGTMTGLLQFTGTTHAGIKLLSLTTAQRDALSASNGMIIYNSTTGELNQYIGGAWSAVASGSTQPTASTTVLGKIKTDVTPAGDPVALIADNPKYDALAGTSGTPSTSNKYVTNDDTATAATANKVARRLAGGNVTVVTETTGNSTTNAASTAFVQQEIALLTPIYTILGSTVNISQSCSNNTLTKIAEFTGLTGDSLDTLELDFEFIGTQDTLSTNDFLYFRFNDDATSYNYAVMTLSDGSITANNFVNSGDSTGLVLAFGDNSPLIALTNVNGKLRIKSTKTVGGTIRGVISDVSSSRIGGNNLGAHHSTGNWNDTSTEVTSIQLYYIQNSGSSSTVTGKVSLYKINR